jgi:hypothetical protein
VIAKKEAIRMLFQDSSNDGIPITHAPRFPLHPISRLCHFARQRQQSAAAIERPFDRLILAALPPLELRGQHCQPNAHLESNSGKILPRPAAINDKRHDPSQSSRAPSRSNNREDRHGLSRQASDSKAQKKSAVGRTELGDAKRSIQLHAKNAAHGTRK